MSAAQVFIIYKPKPVPDVREQERLKILHYLLIAIVET